MCYTGNCQYEGAFGGCALKDKELPPSDAWCMTGDDDEFLEEKGSFE